MATDVLSPDADDSGWPTGTFSDIIADGGGVMSTTVDNDVLIVDFDASVVVDADTVTSVDVVIRGRSTGAGGKDSFIVALLIGGVAQGTDFTSAVLSGTHADIPITGVTQTWTGDYTEAECDGLQIQVTANQTGKGAAATWEVDTLTVTINYTEAASGHPRACVHHLNQMRGQ